MVLDESKLFCNKMQKELLWLKWQIGGEEAGVKKEMGTIPRGVNIVFKSQLGGTSLVAQWLRIRLPMQGTRV